MRKSLHCHLRDGISFEGYEAAAGDLLEPLPNDHYDLEQRTAKRRRIESISTQYMRGQPPLILSARLRGPFNGKWTNPWAKSEADQKERTLKVTRDSHAGSGTTSKSKRIKDGNKRRVAVRSEAQKAVDVGVDAPLDKEQVLIKPTKQVERLQEQARQGNEFGNRVQAPVTSLVTEDNEQSCASEYFSAPADNHTSQRSLENDSQWLKRQELNVEEQRVETSQYELPRTSKTPSRYGTASLKNLGIGNLRGGLPKVPGFTPSSSEQSNSCVLDDQWKSDASASRITSSPIKLVAAASEYSRIVPNLDTPGALERPTEPEPEPKPATVSEQHEDSAIFARCAQLQDPPQRIDSSARENEIAVRSNNQASHVRDVNGPDQNEPPYNATIISPGLNQSRTITPGSEVMLRQESSVKTNEVQSTNRQSPLAAWQNVSLTQSKGRPPSRDDIHRYAERCAVTTRTSTGHSWNKRVSLKTAKESPISMQQTTSRALSPPTASASFTYRKVGEANPKSKMAKKSKPRPMTFDSSPVIQEEDHSNSKNAQGFLPLAEQTKLPGEHQINSHSASAEKTKSHKLGVYEAMANDQSIVESVGHQARQGSLGSSRQSLYSTQAAMMMAQLEFQEETIPSLPSNTPHTYTRIQNDTSQPHFREPSPAITPFHKFNAELDKKHPPTSVLHGPPMSTQDLLAAASPYALSTVKKKTVLPKRSSLRFTVLSNEERNERAELDSPKRSPTPSAERIPLKERNSYVMFRSTLSGSGKGSQESPVPSRDDSTKVVELPQLNLNSSLEGGLGFTGGFLRKLEGLT